MAKNNVQTRYGEHMHSLCLNCISEYLQLMLSEIFKNNLGQEVSRHSWQFVSNIFFFLGDDTFVVVDIFLMFWDTCGFQLRGQMTWVPGIGLEFNHSALQTEAARFLVLSTEQP